MFRRLHVVNDRVNGQIVRVGNQDAADKRRGRDNRAILNVTGTYKIKTLTGKDANVEIVAQRGALPAVKATVHEQEVLIPITNFARSIETDDAGAPKRV